MPQALDSTVAYLGRSFPKFVSLSAGLAALLALPSHVHSRTAKSSQLVLPLLFGALAPGAEGFWLPNRDVGEGGSDRRQLGHERSLPAAMPAWISGKHAAQKRPAQPVVPSAHPSAPMAPSIDPWQSQHVPSSSAPSASAGTAASVRVCHRR